MTNTMDSAHLCTPQSIFQQMNQQSSQQQQVGPWAQIPQVPPISIPWRAPCSHQQELIRFTGDTNSALHTIQQAQKRKLETQDFVDVRQRKQFITAEKMTAHFKGLHISGNHDEPKSSPSTGREGADMDVEVVNATKGEQTNDAHPRLVLSEELKRLKPILPSTFLSKL
ncbi:hypothetical protein DMN91_002979 [Ooceraea biroi]|nr:hypothetical protein DMN91_002979 [Ooceraea biroi]